MNPAEAFAAIPLAALCCDRSFNWEEALVLQSQLRFCDRLVEPAEQDFLARQRRDDLLPL